jgi:transcriptional regulator GlxA family with amidase domain
VDAAFAVHFKRMIGKTPLDFLTSLCLQSALTLLHAAANTSPDAIAKKVGSADGSALRRAYLRASGVPLRRREKLKALRTPANKAWVRSFIITWTNRVMAYKS